MLHGTFKFLKHAHMWGQPLMYLFLPAAEGQAGLVVVHFLSSESSFGFLSHNEQISGCSSNNDQCDGTPEPNVNNVTSFDHLWPIVPKNHPSNICRRSIRSKPCFLFSSQLLLHPRHRRTHLLIGCHRETSPSPPSESVAGLMEVMAGVSRVQ